MRVPLTILHPGLGPGWWTIPTRQGTDDTQVIEEIMVGDVYHLRGLDRQGWADGISGEPKATVIDLGAHIGVFTATALAMGAGRVIAVEPDEDNARLCALTVADAGDRVDLRCQAVGPSGVDAVAVSGTGAQAHTAGQGTTWVPAVSLAHLLGAAGDVALLKCDVEGAEYETFLSCPSELLGRVALIVMEWHGPSECPWVGRARIGELVEHLLPTHSPSVFGRPDAGGYLYAHRN